MSYVLKTNSNFPKTINDFGYNLPNSFTEHFSMAASEYTNKCNKTFFSFQKWKHKNWTRGNQEKEYLREKGWEKGWAVLIFS